MPRTLTPAAEGCAARLSPMPAAETEARELHCHKCGELLNPAKAKWLVRSCSTNGWYETDEEADATGCNQGGFPFGSACAKRVLARSRAAIAAEGRS